MEHFFNATTRQGAIYMEIQLWRSILCPYELAVRELMVKFEHIIDEHKQNDLYSPIEQVSGRVKSLPSILEKMQRKHIPMDKMEEEIEDIAGIRIICQFEEDIDTVAAIIRDRSDMVIKSEKNYLKHINENERGDKGIDDLLVGTLLMHEEELARDFGEAMYSHDGVGRYVSVHKITSRTDNQIMDFWHLNSRKEFFEKYHDSIDGLVTFRFGGIVYVVEDGKFKEAARGGDESNFWTVSVNEKDRKSVEFGYLAALNFLSANSFFKIRTVDLKPGEFRLVKVDDFVVSETSGPEIRDFVYDYVLKSTKDVTVLDSFIARLNNWLGIDCRVQGQVQY